MRASLKLVARIVRIFFVFAGFDCAMIERRTFMYGSSYLVNAVVAGNPATVVRVLE